MTCGPVYLDGERTLMNDRSHFDGLYAAGVHEHIEDIERLARRPGHSQRNDGGQPW